MAEVDWPDYEVPTDALVEGAKPDVPVPAKTDPPVVPPVASPPPAAAAPAAPPAGAPGTTVVPPPAAPDSGGMVPQYRLDEIREQERAATRRVAELQAELDRLKAAPPAAAPPPAAPPPAAAVVNPADEAIRARMLEVFPEFKRLQDLVALAERRGDLEGVVEAQRGYAAAETKYYDQYTATELGALHTLAATHTLGDGKTAKDLPDMAKQAINTAYDRWVNADPARVARFNNLDSSLREEFWPVYRAAIYDSARRADSVAALTAAGQRPPVPVGGAVSAPVAPAPPKPPSSDDNEDAVHERAWAGVQAARGA